MPVRRFAVMWMVLCSFLGLARGQEPVAAPTAPSLRDVPCVIDAQLSLWLALESVDRTIEALGTERRVLASELATSLQALDVLARADDPDGVPFVELTTLLQAQSTGRDAIEENYTEIQHRLIEIDKTLKRRQSQQGMLETKLEALLESSEAKAGAAAGQ